MGRRPEEDHPGARRQRQQRKHVGLERRPVAGAIALRIDAVAHQLDRTPETGDQPPPLTVRMRHDDAGNGGEIAARLHRAQAREPGAGTTRRLRKVKRAGLEARTLEQIIVGTDRPVVVDIEQDRQLAEDLAHARAERRPGADVHDVGRLTQRVAELGFEGFRSRTRDRHAGRIERLLPGLERLDADDLDAMPALGERRGEISRPEIRIGE